jgi:hypothetical protein
MVVSERPEEARRPLDLPAAKPAVAARDKIHAWRPAAAVSASSPELLALESFTCESLAEA